MVIKVKTPADVRSSEITPERIYRSRREFMRTASAGVVGAAAGVWWAGRDPVTGQAAQAALTAKKSAFTTDPKVDPLNTYEQITNYNNYYEFGTDKSDPAKYAQKLTVKPWTVKVDGLVTKPGNYGVQDQSISMSSKSVSGTVVSSADRWCS
jgi:sulfoxide reductase catalytic subunit YedY